MEYGLKQSLPSQVNHFFLGLAGMESVDLSSAPVAVMVWAESVAAGLVPRRVLRPMFECLWQRLTSTQDKELQSLRQLRMGLEGIDLGGGRGD